MYIKKIREANNIKKSNIYIDIGPHKTGTTFRQKLIYPYLSGIDYLEDRNLLHLTIFQNFKNNGKTLISNERLSGLSFLPNHNAVEERNFAVKNIKLLFPNANIIICIRKKETWMKSLYIQYIRAGGKYSYDTWLELMNPNVFDLTNYLSILKENFDNICILKFSDLRNNINKYVNELVAFLNVENIDFENKKLNVSLSNNKIKVLRLFNHIWKTRENPYGIPLFKYWRDYLYKITT